mgnify:FL=1
MLSIIIPVLNEAENITSLLNRLLDVSSEGTISEIIVVDGGSSDGTQKILSSFSNKSATSVNLISSEKGRAKQMNAGAKIASGSILYFLHADSIPPFNYDTLIISEVEKGNPAGCFRMKFDSKHWWLCLAGWLTRFKSKACRGGDQSQFITRELFEEIGGYDESFTIYEDYVLISELYNRKSFVVIPAWLITSARLYERKGIWKLQYHFWTIYIKKFFGASADNLYSYYVKHIAP